MDFYVQTSLYSLILLTVFLWTTGRGRAPTARIVAIGLIGIASVQLIDLVLDGRQLWLAYRFDSYKQYFLPPNSTLYFENFWRSVQPVLISAFGAVLIFSVLAGLKKKFRLEQYGNDDIIFLTLSAWVSGWPGFFISFCAIFLVSLIASIGLHIRQRPADGQIRLIITPFILPVTSVIIWFLPHLNAITGLYKIRF
jgi:hypothetical protein